LALTLETAGIRETLSAELGEMLQGAVRLARLREAVTSSPSADGDAILIEVNHWSVEIPKGGSCQCDKLIAEGNTSPKRPRESTPAFDWCV
jgi:hypothetical protein